MTLPIVTLHRTAGQHALLSRSNLPLPLFLFLFLFLVYSLHRPGALSASVASFSKASFVVSGGATNDVAIDDPDFWTKVVGLAGINCALALALSLVLAFNARLQH